MSQKLLYLATPYSHTDPKVQEQRFQIACEVAGILMQNGIHVFSPIAHTHPIACCCELPKDYAFWQQYDELFLARCDGLIVLTCPGWKESRGVKAEMELADRLGIRLYALEYPDYKTDILRLKVDLK